MKPVIPVPLSLGSTATSADDRPVRILRWTFRRGAEVVSCELGLTGDDSAYRLRIDPPSNPTGVAVECFDSAMPAFQRQAAIERALIADGWSLEVFESTKIDRV